MTLMTSQKWTNNCRQQALNLANGPTHNNYSGVCKVVKTLQDRLKTLALNQYSGNLKVLQMAKQKLWKQLSYNTVCMYTVCNTDFSHSVYLLMRRYMNHDLNLSECGLTKAGPVRKAEKGQNWTVICRQLQPPARYSFLVL